jgi:hypothetical protein
MQGQYWKTSGRATANMLAGDEDASSVKIPARRLPALRKKLDFQQPAAR